MKSVSERPTVLILDEWLPYPCDTGKKIRSYNLLRNLSTKYNIIYLAYADPESEHDSINHLEGMGITVEAVNDDRVPKGGALYWLNVARNIISDEPFAAYYHYTEAFRRKLSESLNRYSPNLIHCEWTFYARYMDDCGSTPVVISAHNVEYQQWERMAAAKKSPLMKVFSLHQADKIKKFEVSHYKKAATCLVVSENDRTLVRMNGANAVLVENGVDTDFFNSELLEVTERTTRMTYTASMDAFSNQDAAVYFMKQILPLIQKIRPEAEFMIVGKNPPQSLTSFAGKCRNVTLTGTVDDVRPFIASAAINIVPLRVGGGTRLKILESMAMGKAVVSTSIGCEGLDLEAGKHLLIADEPDDFADKVLMLMADSKLRNAIAKAACDHVRQRYDWKPIAAIMDNAWQDVLENYYCNGNIPS